MITRLDTGSLELWQEVVRGILRGPTETMTLLDLCCNECTSTKSFAWMRHVGVDVVDWGKPGHVEFVMQDALQFACSTGDNEFDVCICSDGVEHFTKADGWKLVREIDRVAATSIIFCPLGDFCVDTAATHPDHHKSAWYPEELEQAGWSVLAFPKWHPTWNAGAFFAWKGS